jgi:hypothetical protein
VYGGFSLPDQPAIYGTAPIHRHEVKKTSINAVAILGEKIIR